MRVISGKAGGIKLAAPGGLKTRPTSDRVKEALFSILQSTDRLQDVSVLDLFAGSGALGIEALSRGAASAVFVENQVNAARVIRQNLLQARLDNQATIMAMDCKQALHLLVSKGACFDLVFLDPPYQADQYEIVIETVCRHLLHPQGLIVAETASRTPLPSQIGSASKIDQRRYGDTILEFYSLEQQHV